ncbi:nuclear transport factor 2 family protein [Nonomuraea sp. M3C6]|uniref:Nuclear transport factor 2 family protein n=1 Tax=Nonomuraea marmarensis TaxID=3351344 RepID=A0ABW7AXI5_9ACTN
MSIETDVRYLLDRLEIQDVIQRYGIGQDAHQPSPDVWDNNVLEQWDEAFTPAGTVDYTSAGDPGPDAPYRQLAEHMRGKDLRGGGTMSVLANWQHLEGVPTVTIDGDTAHARTPHLHTHKGRHDGPEGWNVVQAGVFHDDLVRTERGWRIAHRRIEIHYVDVVVTKSDLFAKEGLEG